MNITTPITTRDPVSLPRPRCRLWIPPHRWRHVTLSMTDSCRPAWRALSCEAFSQEEATLPKFAPSPAAAAWCGWGRTSCHKPPPTPTLTPHPIWRVKANENRSSLTKSRQLHELRGTACHYLHMCVGMYICTVYTIGWSDLWSFAIFEIKHIAADQLYF